MLRRRLKLLTGITIFLAALAFVVWMGDDTLHLGGDEGIYLTGGRLVALGQQPYRDFFEVTGPLTFWVVGFLGYISGLSLKVMRLPVLFDIAFLTWAVYWFTSRYSDALYAAAAAATFLAYEARVRVLVLNHRWDSGALAIAAIAAALAAQRSGRRTSWALAGILIVAAGFATPSLGIVALPLLVWSVRRRIPSALAFVGGCALAGGAAVLYLQFHHALLPMIDALRWSAANYARPNRVPYGAVFGQDLEPSNSAWKYMVAMPFTLAPAILPPAAVLGWGWLFWRRRLKPEIAAEILPLLAATVFLVFAAWPHWIAAALQHTLALAWSLCALMLYFVSNQRQRSLCARLVLMFSIAVIAFKATSPLNEWPRPTRVGALIDPFNEGDLLDGLEHWVQPGDSLLSFPYLPSLYYFLNARNSTRYTFMQPGMMTAEDERRAVADLTASPPRWVIYQNMPAAMVLTIWPQSDPALIPMEAINGYIRAHYRQVDVVTGRGNRLIVMERW